MKGTQLALAVALADPQDFSHFHPGPNAAVVQTVRGLLDTDEGTALLLHGPAGCGKTHLLQALLTEASSLGLKTLQLDVAALEAPRRALETTPLLCLDGLDTLALDDTSALALLRVIDARRQRAVSTLITSRKPAAQLGQLRPDLITRLGAFASYGLKGLSDEDRIELLRLRASTRGLHLPFEVAQYLLKHLPRDVASLLAAVDVLDGASLAAQRRLTLPFVQGALGLSG